MSIGPPADQLVLPVYHQVLAYWGASLLAPCEPGFILAHNLLFTLDRITKYIFFSDSSHASVTQPKLMELLNSDLDDSDLHYRLDDDVQDLSSSEEDEPVRKNSQ